MSINMKTKCYKCGYEWDCKSKMLWVTCPNCRKMVRTTNNEREPEQETPEHNNDDALIRVRRLLR